MVRYLVIILALIIGGCSIMPLPTEKMETGDRVEAPAGYIEMQKRNEME